MFGYEVCKTIVSVQLNNTLKRLIGSGFIVSFASSPAGLEHD